MSFRCLGKGNKKSRKTLILRDLSNFVRLLSSAFCGERGTLTFVIFCSI